MVNGRNFKNMAKGIAKGLLLLMAIAVFAAEEIEFIPEVRWLYIMTLFRKKPRSWLNWNNAPPPPPRPRSQRPLKQQPRKPHMPWRKLPRRKPLGPWRRGWKLTVPPRLKTPWRL